MSAPDSLPTGVHGTDGQVTFERDGDSWEIAIPYDSGYARARVDLRALLIAIGFNAAELGLPGLAALRCLDVSGIVTCEAKAVLP